MSPNGFSRRAEIGTCISERESLLATLITFSLPLTRRPCIRRLFLFFLPTISVFVLFYRIVVSWLSYSVLMWSLGQHVCRFSAAIAHFSSFWCFGNLQKQCGKMRTWICHFVNTQLSSLTWMYLQIVDRLESTAVFTATLDETTFFLIIFSGKNITQSDNLFALSSKISNTSRIIYVMSVILISV